MMTRFRSSRRGLLRVIAVLSLLPAGAALSGCSGSLIADHLPTAAGGLPAEAPGRQETPTAYPAVHDMPPARSGTMLSNDEQKKLEGDLAAARDRVGPNSDTGATSSIGDRAAGGAKNP
jgi:hypothetical protein